MHLAMRGAQSFAGERTVTVTVLPDTRTFAMKPKSTRSLVVWEHWWSRVVV
jgi:hypothetical protein